MALFYTAIPLLGAIGFYFYSNRKARKSKPLGARTHGFRSHQAELIVIFLGIFCVWLLVSLIGKIAGG